MATRKPTAPAATSLTEQDLAAAAATWWAELELLARVDVEAADRLRAAQWHHLRSTAPEVIAPLGLGPPTEAVPASPPAPAREGNR